MRCKNCGWPNKPNERFCVKCHAELTSDHDGNEEIQPLSKTVMESDVFGRTPSNSCNDSGEKDLRSVSLNSPNMEKPAGNNTCPKCGYPVRLGTEFCPNCRFPLKRIAEDYSHDVQKHTPTRMNVEESRENFRGTINPYMMNMEAEASFVLKPLKRINERADFSEQEYVGKNVVLNRDNTEKNNASITSRQQAIISHTDGAWFIEDASDLKTTFVQAGHKIPLHDGDIILLGNRMFEFHEQ